MLALTPLENFPNILPGNDLAGNIIASLTNTNITLNNDDILVLAQKIISKAEGRQINLELVKPSQQAIEVGGLCEKDPRIIELVLQESTSVLRVRPGTIIVEHRLGFVCANAGIDHSNVTPENSANENFVLLLPENPGKSAYLLRTKLEAFFGVRIGIMIIDSHGRAWRLGVVGTSIGFTGLPGLVDMRGKPDLFGGKLRITQIAVADELAAAASLMMGQANEGKPVIHVRGFPYPLRNGKLEELIRPHEQDMFR
ncbi:MAG: coenzyme F420-0:L-glutamate ligase [Chloroflexi bacterium GWB2_49_20]|nr:MAG: coenzyme F420-0:L-glutamate ligase [Chloroflexi bacterium GWB2_49_20]OGN78897.1 MAG: coenzyme F420-0:L-glutamate ligase [Chloroflexi bacterium GWC2_49_37]OGN86342.1 MAG: coenzyme F420-0:L-glutamate ligase [Chloroflexi bacterium GWD2_49_16]HBG74574.1 coenzyme F420-0:L-glutamate ligase [Anaerolineae bacterium]